MADNASAGARHRHRRQATRKEVPMAVKILIKRTLKDGNLKDATRLLINARSGAMRKKGYISSETWKSMDEPRLVTVVSTWEDIADWNEWYSSPERRENEGRFEPLLAAPTELESYSLGLPFE
jgi:heme-degrading monooxygenase HmoA